MGENAKTTPKVTPDSQKGILGTAFINPTRNIKVEGNP